MLTDQQGPYLSGLVRKQRASLSQKSCCRRRQPVTPTHHMDTTSVASFQAQLAARRCRSSRVVWDKAYAPATANRCRDRMGGLLRLCERRAGLLSRPRTSAEDQGLFGND